MGLKTHADNKLSWWRTAMYWNRESNPNQCFSFWQSMEGMSSTVLESGVRAVAHLHLKIHVQNNTFFLPLKNGHFQHSINELSEVF